MPAPHLRHVPNPQSARHRSARQPQQQQQQQQLQQSRGHHDHEAQAQLAQQLLGDALDGPNDGSNYDALLRLDDNVEAKGLSDARLDELSVVQKLRPADVQRLKDKGEDEVLCAICLELFGPDDVIRRLTCMCFFHKDCIDRHFRTNTSCPVCRRDISSSMPRFA